MTGLLNPKSSEKMKLFLFDDDSRLIPRPWVFSCGMIAVFVFSKNQRLGQILSSQIEKHLGEPPSKPALYKYPVPVPVRCVKTFSL